jgi:hypothetical protein
MTPRPRALTLVGAATLLLLLSACGSSGAPAGSAAGDDGPSVSSTPSAQVTATPAADAKIVAITVGRTSVSPVGGKASVKPGQPVVLRIHADQAGELHVHSSPEQHVDFPAGDSEITLSFKTPGLIAIEDHALNQLIVQVEVS